MDAEGEVLTSQVERSVAGFRRANAALAAERELGEKAKAGTLTPEESVRWLNTRIDLGKVEFAAAQQEFAALAGKLDAAQKKELQGRLNDLEVGHAFTLGRGKPPEEAQTAVVAKLKEMLDAGRLPSDRQALRFWVTLLRDAEGRKDEAMIKKAKDELTALAAREPSQKAMIDRMLNPPARRQDGAGGTAGRRGSGGK